MAEETAGAYGIGMGAMWSSLHILRVLTNRGLLSANEIEQVHASLLEGLQAGDAETAAILEADLTPVFLELRQHARQLGTRDSDA